MPHWIRNACHSPTPQHQQHSSQPQVATEKHLARRVTRVPSVGCRDAEDLTMLGGQDRARPWCSKFGLILDPCFFSQGIFEHEGQLHLSWFYKSTTPNKIHWISCRPHRCWDPFSNVGARILGSWVFGWKSINCKEAQLMSCVTVYGTWIKHD